MPRIASDRVTLHHNGQSDTEQITVPIELQCDSWIGDVKVHHPDHHRCPALLESEPEATLPDSVKLRSIDRCTGCGGYYTVYPRGRGAAAGSTPCNYAKVSRWASLEEAEAWLRYAGTAIPSRVGGDRLYVALPGARKPGGTGPVRVDFVVPKSALIETGKAEWRVIMHPIQSTPIHNVIMTIPNGVSLTNDK